MPPPASPGRAAASWRDRLLGGRDRLLASPRFQRWAARNPLTRRVARARSRALFDLCAGFVYAQVLAAFVELNLAELLAAGPVHLHQVAPQLGLSEAAAERLLAAAAALQLAERRHGGRWGLGPLGAALLGNPGVAAMVRHHRDLYADLADPVALLRGQAGATRLGGLWPYAGTGRPADLPPDAVADYSALMAASQPMVAGVVLDAYPVGRHRRLLDLGGGEGAFVAAAAARAPELDVRVFDLPAVALRAQERFAAAGLGARAGAVGGDLFGGPLPGDADLVTLVRVLHDHDDERVMTLLRAVRASLAPGATLLIAEPMAETPGAEPAGDAYFGFYLLAMGSGRPRRPAVLRAMLEAAGFGHTRLLSTALPLVVRVIVARA